MESVAAECTALKREYDACFQTWYNTVFLQGRVQGAADGTANRPCPELYQRYHDCLQLAWRCLLLCLVLSAASSSLFHSAPQTPLFSAWPNHNVANLHFWVDLCSSSLDGVRAHPLFPNRPHGVHTVRKLDLHYATSNFAQRIFGFLNFSLPGTYQLSLSCRGCCQLRLATNARPAESRSAVHICNSNRDRFDVDRQITTLNVSSTVQGNLVYFDLLHQQGSQGSDHLQLAWRAKSSATSVFAIVDHEMLRPLADPFQRSVLLDPDDAPWRTAWQEDADVIDFSANAVATALNQLNASAVTIPQEDCSRPWLPSDASPRKMGRYQAAYTGMCRWFMVHMIIPVQNQGGWVLYLLANLEAIMKATHGRERFNLVLVDYYSDDLDVEQALAQSTLPHWQIVRVAGQFSRAEGVQRGLDAVAAKIQANPRDEIVISSDLHVRFPIDFFMRVRENTLRGKTAYNPVVLRLDCERYAQNPHGYWETVGYGIIALFLNDWRAIGGMNVQEFRSQWGGEDWELFDRIIGHGLECVRDRVEGFYHFYHSKSGMWGGHNPLLHPHTYGLWMPSSIATTTSGNVEQPFLLRLATCDFM
ncbi:uncharacterized protein MONBRDRAFT_29432 [Monosiga brevicollis MX1]|uniref:Hexosyltransferase n=1 Tax=Monosiga brevicollis TaxID=81824 RepID=A9VB29_MONBE|nr:uncharacterized protein MONBRDRAFT_29432 [Monosiga brevicollis MX1]EDQ85266.1 predicted protein [Monosiga brevicollis MX1]|eukprot:XP_001749887.1 hypothetical protein [Monosiga brevicollis MX1]